MGFFKEFKAFAMKGNVMDLAVGVIIGAAFGKIVTALVDDLLMPLIAMFSGGAKFNDKFLVLPGGEEKFNALPVKSLEEVKKAGINVFAYGDFIQTIVDFLIIALCIFMVIKVMNGMKKREEEAAVPPAGPSSTDQLLMEIRDELKKN